MDTPWGPNRKILVDKLVKGKGFANKLQMLFHNQIQDDHLSVSSSDSAQQLVMDILTSFSDTISVLSSCNDSGELSDQIPAAVGYVGSTCSVDRTSACSGDNRKRLAVKDRRGCYKRRKTSDSRIVVAPIPEDEYAWRKYGQKEILNAKNPRCYFRCTHKYDQGCKALKQVQKLEDGSNMYHITYFSHHTCKTLVKSTTQIFQDDPLGSFLLSFESKAPSTKTPIPLIKEEPRQKPKQEQCEVSDDFSSADSNLWKEIIGIGSSNDMPAIMGFDQDDVASEIHDHSSASNSCHGLEMDFLLKSVDFNSEFPFGEME